MARATNAFQDEPSGTIERGRGGFYRNALDTPYVTELAGGVVKSGPRKGMPKRTPYGSPSGFGKLIENSKALEKWGERRVVVGIGSEAARGEYTILSWCVELARIDVDSAEYRELADRIVVRCKEVAEADLAANRGTHGHAIVEDDDEGRDWIERAEAGELLGIPVDAQRAMVQAWRDMLGRYGLEILCSEASCIDDTWRLAGTLDNVARCTKTLRFRLPTGEIRIIPAGTVVVLDKKTGQRRLNRDGTIQYWHGYVIQVASYAQSVPYDTEAEIRGEWQWPIDQTHALIAHLDVLGAIDGAPSCELVYVDLVAGRELGGATVLKAKEWAARDDLLSVAIIDDTEGTTGSAAEPAAPIDTVPAAVSTPPERTSPAPEAASPLRAAQLERSATVDAAEARRATARPAPPDEGDDLSAAEYTSMWDLMRAQFEELRRDETRRAWMTRLISEAREAGVGFQAQAAPTARRSHIYRAVLTLAAHRFDGTVDRDQLMRELVACAMDTTVVLEATIPLGQAVGMLGATEAATFADLVCSFLNAEALAG